MKSEDEGNEEKDDEKRKKTWSSKRKSKDEQLSGRSRAGRGRKGDK